jgi:addiction module HigA family antidote
MVIKVHPSFAIHAGGWLRSEIVVPNKVSINELAEAFKVSRQSISALLTGRAALTADMAVRFEHAFGVRAETLMRMQARYELAKAREHEDRLPVESLIAA